VAAIADTIAEARDVTNLPDSISSAKPSHLHGVRVLFFRGATEAMYRCPRPIPARSSSEVMLISALPARSSSEDRAPSRAEPRESKRGRTLGSSTEATLLPEDPERSRRAEGATRMEAQHLRFARSALPAPRNQTLIHRSLKALAVPAPGGRGRDVRLSPSPAPPSPHSPSPPS
jgi:hypothetical protein